MFDNYIDDEQKRKQWYSKQEQQRAIDDYARQKEEIDNAHPDKQTGLSGLLSNLTRDMKSVKNTALATGAAILSPIIQRTTEKGVKATQAKGNDELDSIAKKYGYENRQAAMDDENAPDDMWKEMQGISKKTSEGIKNVSDMYKVNPVINKINNTKQSQYGADAIHTWTDIARALSGGSAANPATGALLGALDGFADSVESTDGTLIDLEADLSGGKIKSTKDTNMDWEDAKKRALIGAAAGAVGGGLAGKIGNATSGIGSKLFNNKLITSGIGSGAAVGAASGAVGGGLGAALEGGDIAGAALQGAGSGALTGGIAGGVTSGAKKVGTKVTDKLGLTDKVNAARQKLTYSPEQKTVQPTIEQENDVRNVLSNESADELPDYTKPKDWAGNELTLERKNFIEKMGDSLENTGKTIRDQDIYNKLSKKTADKVVKNDSIERLRKLGFDSGDYDDAAKLSTAANKFFDDIVKASKATIVDTDFADRAKKLPKGVVLTDNEAKTFNNEVNGLMTLLETHDRMGYKPGEYEVGVLLDQSREFNSSAAAARKNHPDLAKAYSKVGKDLRAMADKGTDNMAADKYTKQQYTTMLKNAGANKDTIDYLADYKNLSEAINKTSLLEDARTMSNEMKSSVLSRSGTNSGTEKVATQILRKSGLPQVVGTVLTPVGKAAGAAVTGLGKAMRGASNIGSMPVTTSQNTRISPTMPGIYAYFGTNIGRDEGESAANDAAKNRAYANLETQLANNMANIANTYGTGGLDTLGGASYGYGNQTGATSQITAQLEQIQNGMDRAFAAGDFTSYNKLADLYEQAYSIYKLQNQSGASSNLSTAEKNQMAKLQSAGNAIDELEALYQKAGGGQGIVAGNFQNWLGSIGLNSDVSTYNQLSQGLINQIGAAIGKTDALNTEGEIQRALSLVPKITDDAQTAKNKLASLRSLLQDTKDSYYDLYTSNSEL